MPAFRFIFITLLLLPVCPPIIGQTTEQVEQVLSQVNHQVSGIAQGYFDNDILWKSAVKNDTVRHAARIYFFRQVSDQDSICQFVILLDGMLWKAYDGTFFYYVNSETGTILCREVSEKGSVKKFLTTGVQDMLAFRSYIFGAEKAPFDLAKLKSAQIDTTPTSTGPLLRLTYYDSFPNPLNESKTAYLKEVYFFSLPSLTLRQKKEWIDFMETPQYLETNLSKIVPMPASLRFQDVFPLDSLLHSGYDMTNKRPQTSNLRSLVQPGDTLPAFVLNNLNGEPVRFWEGPDSLVLFDFWYRSCGYCLKAMPALEKLHRQYEGRLKIWGINPIDQDGPANRAFLMRRGVTFSSLLDPGRELSARLGVTGYPTTILAETKSRKVLQVWVGYHEAFDTIVADCIDKK